jgi:hypothetical protein
MQIQIQTPNKINVRGDEKSPSLTQKDFVNAVKELKEKLQRERDLKREEIHRILLIAMHTDALWEKGA